MDGRGEPGTGQERWNLTRRQTYLVGLIMVLAVVTAAYRLVYTTGLQRTAALYVGIPALLAVGLVLLPRSRSATGGCLKGVTVALLLATVILPEGLICLLFVLPLVYLAAAVVGGVVDWTRARRRRQGPTLLVASLPLLVLSLEGVLGTPFDPHDAVVSSVEVAATPAEVEAALAATPRFDAGLPTFLRVGFNRPVAADGSGLRLGDRRVIEFEHGSHDDHPANLVGLVRGREAERSTMWLRVAASEPGRVVLEVERDTTMLSRWLDLERAVVTWEAVGEGRTLVRWRLEYERLLYPSFYFAPLQRFGMAQAADYLLEAVVEGPLETS